MHALQEGGGLGTIASPALSTNRPRQVTQRQFAVLALIIFLAVLLTLSLASCLVTLYAASRSSLAMVRPDWVTRYGNAVLSYVHYVESFAWPARLAPLYPYPRTGIPGATATPIFP